jgi:serine-type D-Ala-D-Ala carboxypeptidase (penicillin-binding protein 5/6)
VRAWSPLRPPTRAAGAAHLLALTLLVAVSLGASASARAASGRPEVSASSAIVVDARDGHVIYERAPDARNAIASTTKLMTALVSIEELPLGRRLRAAPYHAAAVESQIGLRPGERMSVADLLRALMLESANDAAETLARGAAGSVRRFVHRMNRRARELGLRATRYANPVGLDEPGNYSSARDLSRLARLVLRHDFLAETVAMPRARLLSGSHERIVANRNDLVGRVPWIKGVKTGHTAQAGYVLIGAGRRKGATLVSVALHTPSEAARDADTLHLLDFGFGRYRRARALRSKVALARPKVAFFGDRRVPLVPARSLTVGVRRGQRLHRSIDAPRELHGPIERGTRVGTVTVRLSGRRLATVPLLTAAPVPRAGFARKAAHYAVRPLLLAALVVLAVVALERRRHRQRAADAAARRRRAGAPNR